MARQSNADRVFEQYLMGGWPNKSDKLRIDQSGQITSCGTPIGYIFDEELDDRYEQMLVLTLQDFKSQPTWSTHRKSLIRSANKYGLPVVFVPEVDIGFGVEPPSPAFNVDFLVKVAKFAEGNEIKTAAWGVTEEAYVAYSCNQFVEGEWLHAESILAQYFAMKQKTVWRWYSMLEPCSHCIQRMINNGAEVINFGYCHKAKWDTPEYIELTNELSAKRILSVTGTPVNYDKYVMSKVTKFFEGGCK